MLIFYPESLGSNPMSVYSWTVSQGEKSNIDSVLADLI